MEDIRIWITSDTHFNHNRDFIFLPRGFSSVEEMNNEIVKRWNSVVGENDLVYHLGDIMLNDNEKGIEYLKQLNGRICILRGNHDTDSRINLYKQCPNVFNCGSLAKIIKYKKYRFYLSHYPTLTSNYREEDISIKSKLINLCGHTHTTDKFKDFKENLIYHCEMDAHNCYPVLLDDIIEDIKNKVKE